MKRAALPFLFLVITLFLTASFAFAETAVPRWFVCHSQLLDADSRQRIESDPQGNLYVLGSAKTGGSSMSLDILLIKYDPDGNELWSRLYNGSGQSLDYAEDLAVDEEGNVIVVGSTWFNQWRFPALVLKYDPDGTLLWEQVQGKLVEIVLAEGVLTDSAGNIYVGGQRSRTEANRDFFVMKFDAGGTLLWENDYNGPSSEDDFFAAMALDGEGNVYAAGTTEFNYDYSMYGKGALVKFDADGTRLWVTVTDDFIPYQILTATDGSIVAGGSQMQVARYDGSGTRLWLSGYDGCPADWNVGPAYIALDAEGGIGAAGTCSQWQEYPPELLDMNIAAAGLDVDGGLRWTSVFDRGSMAGIRAIQANATGYVITGSEDSDILTLKYDVDGNELWVATYPGSQGLDDAGTDLVLDGAGSLYVTGYVNRDYQYATAGTLKYTLEEDSDDDDDDSPGDDDDATDDDAASEAGDEDDDSEDEGCCGG